MAEQVLHRYAHRLSRFGIAQSVAGDGLLDRMRTTTFALLGITAAVGLAFVALIASQGWPALPLGPILGPRAHEAIGEATAVTGNPTVANKGGRRATAGGVGASPGSVGVPNAAHSGSTGSAVSGSHRLVPVPPASAHGGPSNGKGTRGVAAPTKPPASAPSSTPAATTVAPTPTESAPEAPSSSPPPVTAGVGNGHGNGHAYGRDGDRGERKSDGTAGHQEVEDEGESPTVAEPEPPTYHGRGSHGYGHGHSVASKPASPPAEDTTEGAESSSQSSFGPYGEGHGSDHGHGHH